jgi:hypothetical protein
MTFSHINRRVHLYLALALLPWFFMYGVSSVPFAHNQFFERRDAAKGLPLWTLRSEHAVDVPVPDDPGELRAFGATLLASVGISDTDVVNYGVYRQNPNQLNVYVYSFWKSTQLKYFINEKRLTVEDRRFRWEHFLTGMHARGGFEQAGPLQRSWSVVVDLVCVGIVLWVATGVYMWWGVPASRRWGWAAIAAGTVSFLVFTLRL